MLVRSARPKELDRVAELSVEAYAELAPFLEPGGWQRMREGILSVARRDGCSVIVAEEREGLGGSVAYFPPGSEKGKAYLRRSGQRYGFWPSPPPTGEKV